MLNWKPSSPDSRIYVLQRHDEYLELAASLKKERKESVKFWGRVHLCLGILTVFLTTMSAVLTFYNEPKTVAGFSVPASVSAAILTFLNPSKRAMLGRTAVFLILSFEQRVRNSAISIESAEKQQQQMSKMKSEVEALNKDFGILLEELEKLENYIT